jgi:hypothetical protein
VGVQEVRGTELAEVYTIFCGKGIDNHEFGTGFLCEKEYQQLRGLNLLVMGCHT